MKKFLFLICAGVLIMILSGCEKQLLDGSDNIINNFEKNVKIIKEDKKYECNIIHTPEGVNTVKFINPKNLKDLTFLWENGKYTVALKELRGEYNVNPWIENSDIVNIIKILDSLNNSENLKFSSIDKNMRSLKGTIENIDYEVAIDEKGNIVKIVIPTNNVTAEFSE